MRYAKTPPLFFCFLPGLLLVVEFVAPEHLSPRRSIAPSSRDEGKNSICKLHARRVVFSFSLSVFSSINIYRLDADYPCHRRDKLRLRLENAAMTISRTMARL